MARPHNINRPSSCLGRLGTQNADGEGVSVSRMRHYLLVQKWIDDEILTILQNGLWDALCARGELELVVSGVDVQCGDDCDFTWQANHGCLAL